MPETKIGLFTDIGASYFLPRLLNNSLELGVYLGLTGDKVQGKDLAISGVATHYIKEDKFAKLKEILIEKVNSKTNKENLKALISENSDITFSQDKFAFNNFEAIKYAFKPDSLEGIFTRLNNLVLNKFNDEKEEKLIKSFYNENTKTWAEKCLKSLNSHSPLSLVITLELLKRGQKLSNIEEAFNLEAQLVSGFMEDSDFFEGVRALLVDKDNNPKWASKTYKDINTQEVIKKYFERKEEIEVDQKL
jgi:3-hydroxyisobutyryl-CoA hydrolase